LRLTSRSGLFSPQAAPVRPPTSSSISRSAAKPIISRSRSASAVFSTRPRRVIISSVIVVSGSGWCHQPDPTEELAMTTTRDTTGTQVPKVAIYRAECDFMASFPLP